MQGENPRRQLLRYYGILYAEAVKFRSGLNTRSLEGFAPANGFDSTVLNSAPGV
jgi:hypothetical protein